MGRPVTVDLGYQQQAKLDLSGVANEKMTLVHIGEKLVILFDNNATVTVEPFFDSGRAPAEPHGGGWPPVVDCQAGGEFACRCSGSPPGQSVLPAAAAQKSTFRERSLFQRPGLHVEPLLTTLRYPLLGPEELPNWVVNFRKNPSRSRKWSFRLRLRRRRQQQIRLGERRHSRLERH